MTEKVISLMPGPKILQDVAEVHNLIAQPDPITGIVTDPLAVSTVKFITNLNTELYDGFERL